MTNSFIISPYDISYESIRDSLMNYVQNKPDNESWKDFYASAAGQTVIELAAALGAMYSYQFILGRREAFLSTAQNYSSVVGLAENLGYCVSRGNNAKVTLRIVPNQTVTLSKWDVVGSYTEYDVVLIEDAVLNSGVASDINVVIGNFMQEEQTVTTNRLNQFVFSNSQVTNDIRLLLNGTEVPTTTVIQEGLNDKYITLTNVFGSVDIFYLQEGNYQYKSGDTLTLQFIERNSLLATSLSRSNFTIDYATRIDSITTYQESQAVEDIGIVKVKAPIYHEMSMVIRSRKDYSKFLLLADNTLIAANDNDIYPGLIEITYLKNDGSQMTEAQKEYWLSQIEEARPSGVAKAIITDPIKIDKSLEVQLWRQTGSNISSSVSAQINQILQNYENTFEIVLNMQQIEHDVEQLDGVQVARVRLKKTVWEANTFYNLYDIIVPTTESPTDDNAKSYYASQFLYFSGSAAPTWPTTVNETVIDNNLIWQKVDEFQGLATSVWEANTAYAIYDYVKDSTNSENIFKCIGYVGKSGTDEPTWNTQSDQVNDNEIVWQKLDTYDDEAASWAASTDYKVGDVIKPTIDQLNFRCIGFRASSSGTEPEWGDTVGGGITDGRILWTERQNDLTSIALKWNEYLSLTSQVTIVG